MGFGKDGKAHGSVLETNAHNTYAVQVLYNVPVQTRNEDYIN